MLYCIIVKGEPSHR